MYAWLLSSALLLQPALLPAEAWLCWMRSGKGEDPKRINDALPLRWYTENLAAFDAEIDWRVRHDPGWQQITSATAKIGTFEGRDVIDVLYRIPNSGDPVAKMVLVGEKGRYRPVVYILNDSQVRFAPSRILK